MLIFGGQYNSLEVTCDFTMFRREDKSTIEVHV
jgi:hypothetical protein